MADELTPSAPDIFSTPEIPADAAPSGAAEAPVSEPAITIPLAPDTPIPGNKPVEVSPLSTSVSLLASAEEASDEEPSEPLPTEVEAEHQAQIEDSYRQTEALEAEANVREESSQRFHVGSLHSDTVYVTPPKIGNEGPRQEQIHTNL